MLRIFFLGIVISLSCLVVQVRANPIISVKTSFYDITGSNLDEIRRAIKSGSPTDQYGKRFDAVTRWNLTWHYQLSQKMKRCYLDHLIVEVKVEMIFPRLADTTALKPVAREALGRYLTALFIHEQGHKKHGLLAANEVEEALSSMSSTETCHLLKESANTLGQAVLQKYQEADRRYDETTDHGKTQGVRFP